VSILVLGIGNLLMADDSVGVRIAQGLSSRYRFPLHVKVLDGGTLGLDLLPRLEGVDRLLMVDAVETGDKPGTMVRLTGEDIPLALETKVSPHQMGLKDLLTVASLQGNVPREMVLWGVQPASIELDMVLSPEVAEMMPFLEEKVLEELRIWDVSPERI
jgi:hydrogenase maturation protease